MNFKVYIRLIAVTLFVNSSCYNENLLYHKKPASYCYIIGDIQGDHIDQEYAADVYATPASCQKVITALVALKTLGSDYRYETSLSVTKHNKSIQDIVISFSGDPTCTSDALCNLLMPLRNSQVEGTIFLDASIFKTPPHSINLMRDDLGKQYAQPVYGINIDKNLITVKITPTGVGEYAFVQADAPYTIASDITTTVQESAFTLSWDGDVIKATGGIQVKKGTVETRISPLDIDAYILHKVTCVLKTLNIQGALEVVNDKNALPVNRVLINTIKSQPLSEIIVPALKQSDNFIFDSLYLAIIHSQVPEGVKNWSDGDAIIKALVHKHFSIDLSGSLLVDGSGLSRYNRIQPRKLLALLKQGFLIPEFVAALAKPGEQKSTLEKRTILPPDIRAKTGNIGGISCLCGYSIKPGSPKAFVIMANSFAPPLAELINCLDTFISENL